MTAGRVQIAAPDARASRSGAELGDLTPRLQAAGYVGTFLEDAARSFEPGTFHPCLALERYPADHPEGEHDRVRHSGFAREAEAAFGRLCGIGELADEQARVGGIPTPVGMPELRHLRRNVLLTLALARGGVSEPALSPSQRPA